VTQYEVVPATTAHADIMAPRMRDADVKEAWASHKLRPRAALVHAALVSRDPKVGLADGEPICMFGIGKLSPFDEEAHPWLLGTDQLEQHAFAFLHRNKAYLAEAREEHPVLRNYVDARNLASIKWLTWLGFTIFPAEPYGPFGAMFHPFEMRAESV